MKSTDDIVNHVTLKYQIWHANVHHFHFPRTVSVKCHYVSVDFSSLTTVMGFVSFHDDIDGMMMTMGLYPYPLSVSVALFPPASDVAVVPNVERKDLVEGK
jgi:hypothetical protein